MKGMDTVGIGGRRAGGVRSWNNRGGDIIGERCEAGR